MTQRLSVIIFWMFMIFFLAALPFIAKLAVLWLGLVGYLAQSSYKLVQLFIPIVWRFQQGNRGLRLFWPTNERRPLPSVWIRATLVALMFSGIAIILLQLFLPRWGLDPAQIREGFDSRFIVSSWAAIAIVIFTSLINSALEELHFRVWMDREISQKLGDAAGIGLSACAFGSMHALIFWGLPGFTPGLIAIMVLGLTLAGAMWSVIQRLPGGIHAAWWSHSLTDILLLGWGLHWLGYL